MHTLSSLLKNIERGRGEMQMLADTISQLAGVLIHKKDLEIRTQKGSKKIQFKISGSKRAALVLKRTAIKEKLLDLGFILEL